MEEVANHRLRLKCNLVSKVYKIEEILFKVLSLNFADYYNPDTLVERIQLAIRAACVDNIVNKQLSKIAMEYDLSPEKYEQIFYFHRVRSLVIVLWENRMRQGDTRGAEISKRDYVKLSDAICKQFNGVKKIC